MQRYKGHTHHETRNPDWGLNTTFVAAWDVEQIRAATRPNTRLIIIETPSNPMMTITDIRAVADIAHAAGALLVCDNTIATPIFQQPLALGADVVVHATTKYLGGHSDLLGGAVVVKDADHPFVARLQVIQKVGGAVPSPFDCWLTMRGLFTLPQRMKAIQANGLAVAAFLAGYARIEQVLHVGHPSHPQYALGARQMSGYSGLFSFLVKGTATDAIGITNRLRLIKRATSFGGVHSTIEHRASVEVGTTTPHNLLRLSVGLEHPDDLIDDLSRALGD